MKVTQVRADLRKKSDAELVEEVNAAYKAMFSLRMQRSTGGSVKGHEFKQAKKLIARVKTIAGERERSSK